MVLVLPGWLGTPCLYVCLPASLLAGIHSIRWAEANGVSQYCILLPRAWLPPEGLSSARPSTAETRVEPAPPKLLAVTDGQAQGSDGVPYGCLLITLKWNQT